MSFEKSNGLGVLSQYGQRGTGGANGVMKTFGHENAVIVDLNEDEAIDGLEAVVYAGSFIFGLNIDDVTSGGGTLDSVGLYDPADPDAPGPVIELVGGVFPIGPTTIDYLVKSKYTGEMSGRAKVLFTKTEKYNF